MSVRRDRQRRAAYALIGFCVVLALAGTVLFLFNNGSKGDNLDQKQRARQAFAAAVDDLDQVFGHDTDLLKSNPTRAGELLKDAYAKLDEAERYGVPISETGPKRQLVVAGLNRYYHVVWLNPKAIVSFGTDTLGETVLGPDGAAYVLDSTQARVYRVDLVARTKKAVLSKGEEASGGPVGTPKLMAVGGPDVLVLDDNNALWRWRPTAGDTTGGGTLVRLRVDDAKLGRWGGNIRAIGTYVTNADAGLYALYVVDPKQKEVVKYLAAADGSGYPLDSGNNYFQVPEPVDGVEDMLIDGSLYLVEDGQLRRYDGGTLNRGWSVKPPADASIRAGAPRYRRLASPTAKDVGLIYLYDSTNKRVLAFDKETGSFDEQYMIGGPGTSVFPGSTPSATPTTGASGSARASGKATASAKPKATATPSATASATGSGTAGAADFSSIGAMFVLPGPNGENPTLFWTENGQLMSAALNPDAASAQPTASPTPSARPSASPTKKH